MCDSSDHTHSRGTPCTAEPLCVNCGEQHPAFDRTCLSFKVEKEALHLSIVQSITLPQALRLTEQSTGHPVTYTTTVALSQHSVIVAGSSAFVIQMSSSGPLVSLDPYFK